jgi:hypothetical protein
MNRATTTVIVALTLFAGCQTQDVSQVGDEAKERIAYAARAKYPASTQPSQQVQFVALDDRAGRRVEVYNLTDQIVPAEAVWVNGSFVAKVEPIGPKGHVTVKYSELLQAGPDARSLSTVNQLPERVELQTPQGLYRATGPAVRF